MNPKVAQVGASGAAHGWTLAPSSGTSLSLKNREFALPCRLLHEMSALFGGCGVGPPTDAGGLWATPATAICDA